MEQHAPANGLTLCYETFGNPADPPLLLIMGLGAQMVLWDDDFCVQLAAQGLRVIRFDNRDCGRSTWLDLPPPRIDLAALTMAALQRRPIPGPYGLRDMADDTAGLLEALGIESAHIAGASMGGMIAQELAIHHPRRVRSLVSIMSSTGRPGLPGPTPEAAAVLMAPPAPGRAEFIANFQNAWRVLRAGAFPEDEARDPVRAALIWDRGVNPAGTARQLLAIFKSGDRTQALARVTVPTLVIHGTPDPLVRVEAGRATAAAIPGARLLEVPRMGHALPMALWPEIIPAIAAHCRSRERDK